MGDWLAGGTDSLSRFGQTNALGLRFLSFRCEFQSLSLTRGSHKLKDRAFFYPRRKGYVSLSENAH